MLTESDRIPAPDASDLGTATSIGRGIAYVLAVVVIVGLLGEGFFFLRDSTEPRLLVAGFAIIWASPASPLFFLANRLVEHLPLNWSVRLQPFIFVGPAIIMVGYFLALPTVRTFFASLFDRDGSMFVGLDNYATCSPSPSCW